MAAILWMTDRWSSTNSAVIFSILPFCILICFCHCNHHSFPSKKCQSCGNHHKLTQSVFYNTSPPFDFAAFSAASFTGGFAAASFCLSFRSFNTDPFSSDFSSISVFFSCCLGSQIIEFIQVFIFSQLFIQPINITVIITNEPFFIRITEIIF